MNPFLAVPAAFVLGGIADFIAVNLFGGPIHQHSAPKTFNLTQTSVPMPTILRETVLATATLTERITHSIVNVATHTTTATATETVMAPLPSYLIKLSTVEALQESSNSWIYVVLAIMIAALSYTFYSAAKWAFSKDEVVAATRRRKSWWTIKKNAACTGQSAICHQYPIYEGELHHTCGDDKHPELLKVIASLQKTVECFRVEQTRQMEAISKIITQMPTTEKVLKQCFGPQNVKAVLDSVLASESLALTAKPPKGSEPATPELAAKPQAAPTAQQQPTSIKCLPVLDAGYWIARIGRITYAAALREMAPITGSFDAVFSPGLRQAADDLYASYPTIVINEMVQSAKFDTATILDPTSPIRSLQELVTAIETEYAPLLRYADAEPDTNPDCINTFKVPDLDSTYDSDAERDEDVLIEAIPSIPDASVEVVEEDHRHAAYPSTPEPAAEEAASNEPNAVSQDDGSDLERSRNVARRRLTAISSFFATVNRDFSGHKLTEVDLQGILSQHGYDLDGALKYLRKDGALLHTGVLTTLIPRRETPADDSDVTIPEPQPKKEEPKTNDKPTKKLRFVIPEPATTKSEDSSAAYEPKADEQLEPLTLGEHPTTILEIHESSITEIKQQTTTPDQPPIVEEKEAEKPEAPGPGDHPLIVTAQPSTTSPQSSSQEALDDFNGTFPHGFCCLPSRVDGNLCGFYAVINAINTTFSGLEAPTIEELKAILHSQEFVAYIAPLLVEKKDDDGEGYEPDHIAVVLSLWLKQRKLQAHLRLGIFQQGGGIYFAGERDNFGSDVRAVTIWIQNDMARKCGRGYTNHYEAMVPCSAPGPIAPVVSEILQSTMSRFSPSAPSSSFAPAPASASPSAGYETTGVYSTNAEGPAGQASENREMSQSDASLVNVRMPIQQPDSNSGDIDIDTGFEHLGKINGGNDSLDDDFNPNDPSLDLDPLHWLNPPSTGIADPGTATITPRTEALDANLSTMSDLMDIESTNIPPEPQQIQSGAQAESTDVSFHGTNVGIQPMNAGTDQQPSVTAQESWGPAITGLEVDMQDNDAPSSRQPEPCTSHVESTQPPRFPGLGTETQPAQPFVYDHELTMKALVNANRIEAEPQAKSAIPRPTEVTFQPSPGPNDTDMGEGAAARNGGMPLSPLDDGIDNQIPPLPDLAPSPTWPSDMEEEGTALGPEQQKAEQDPESCFSPTKAVSEVLSDEDEDFEDVDIGLHQGAKSTDTTKKTNVVAQLWKLPNGKYGTNRPYSVTDPNSFRPPPPMFPVLGNPLQPSYPTYTPQGTQQAPKMPQTNPSANQTSSTPSTINNPWRGFGFPSAKTGTPTNSQRPSQPADNKIFKNLNFGTSATGSASAQAPTQQLQSPFSSTQFIGGTKNPFSFGFGCHPPIPSRNSTAAVTSAGKPPGQEQKAQPTNPAPAIAACSFTAVKLPAAESKASDQTPQLMNAASSIVPSSFTGPLNTVAKPKTPEQPQLATPAVPINATTPVTPVKKRKATERKSEEPPRDPITGKPIFRAPKSRLKSIPASLLAQIPREKAPEADWNTINITYKTWEHAWRPNFNKTAFDDFCKDEEKRKLGETLAKIEGKIKAREFLSNEVLEAAQARVESMWTMLAEKADARQDRKAKKEQLQDGEQMEDDDDSLEEEDDDDAQKQSNQPLSEEWINDSDDAVRNERKEQKAKKEAEEAQVRRNLAKLVEKQKEKQRQEAGRKKERREKGEALSDSSLSDPESDPEMPDTLRDNPDM